MTRMCTRCGSKTFRKNGRYQGIQRYLCKICQKCFSDKQRKFDYTDKMKALDMYLNNVGVRKVARFMNASPSLIIGWIRQFGEQLCSKLESTSKQLSDALPEVIEMDEVYTFVKKNRNEQSYGLLMLEGKVVLLRL